MTEEFEEIFFEKGFELEDDQETEIFVKNFLD